MRGTSKRTRHLRILGASRDRAGLETLAQALAARGFSVEVVVRSGSLKSPDSPLVQDVIVWTKGSVARQSALVRHATALLTQRRYVGLLKDGAIAPAALVQARHLPFSTFEDPPAELLQALAVGPGLPDGKGHARLAIAGDAIRRSVTLAFAPDQRGKTLRRLGAVVGAIIGWVWFLANLDSNMEGFCRNEAFYGPCRLMKIDSVPSVAQLAQWRRISPRSDCAAFEMYLDQHGPNAPFAEHARQRLALSKSRLETRPVVFKRTIQAWEAVPAQNTATALKRIRILASEVAIAHCRLAAQPFKGLERPGEFVPAEAPVCESGPDGIGCRWAGSIRCDLIMEGASMTCRPPEAVAARP